MDYRYEDSFSFPVSATCVTFPNPGSLSSSETGVNLECVAEKSTCLNVLDDRELLVVSVSRSKKLRVCIFAYLFPSIAYGLD
jgi:hypothetical protein